jgi:hypothetical protein
MCVSNVRVKGSFIGQGVVGEVVVVGVVGRG